MSYGYIAGVKEKSLARTIYRGYGHLELLGERACIVIEN